MISSTGSFNLGGRTALITGAGGRLGSRFASALLDAGANVALAGRDPNRLDQLASELDSDRIERTLVDVTSEADVAKMFQQVRDRFGGLDVLVNNAGTASATGLGDSTANEVSRVLDVNVVGVLLCAKHAAKLMGEAGGGKIINVGSIYGTVAATPSVYEGAEQMVACSPAYAASKSALVNLTRDLAVRLATDNIQVNMISPGGVEADQPEAFKQNYAARTPAGRMARADDLVGTLVYLAAPASDYVTGQNIHVDGGFTIQ